MELEAAKMIGAGLAAIALAGAGVGIGIIFGNYLSGAMRNPSAAQKQFPNLLLGFALAEATGLFGLVVALIILFAFQLMLKKIIILVFVTCFACFNTVFAAESGGMPQLNPEFWISQIFWLIITFGILFIVLTKVILPKISDNLETRKSQILENIETADKQKEESQKKIDEYEKIILESKIKAKNYFNDAREKILEDINKKRAALEKELDEEISSTENELSEFKKSSGDKVIKIAAETSAELIKELIGEGLNSSSIAAIVEDQAKMNKERKDVI